MVAARAQSQDYDFGLLTTLTLDKLERYFNTKTNHRPSPETWAALTDIATTLEQAANGGLEPKAYLSSLDCGQGKTQTVVAFVDTLLGASEYDHVGVLICLSRIAEIKSLVQRMGVPKEWLCVLTQDASANALGLPEERSDEARVIITSQQRMEKHLDGASFNDAREFHYRGKRRHVVIWDEAWLPGVPLTVNRDDISFLFKSLRPTYPKLTDDLEDMFVALRNVEDGARFVIPDFTEAHGVELNDVLHLYDNPRDKPDEALKEDQRLAMSALWYLSGRTVTVRQDGRYGNTALDYRDTFPADLSPILILDASGRVRTTYADIEKERGTLVRLKTSPKHYGPLTVNVWTTGGGKGSFRRNGDKLIEGIAATINTKPNEEWLVVVHKATRDGNVGERIRDLVDAGRDKVHVLTWGSHSATNDYSHVPNVILAGTLFYRPSHYEALGRLSAGVSSDRGAYSKQQVRKIELGEHSHLILQALCRGTVRSADGNRCRPCSAYIIASARSGIPGAIRSIFPGCRVQRWKPVERELKGRVGQAVAVIADWLDHHSSTKPFLPFKEVQRAIGIKYSSSFSKDIRNHPDFAEAVAEFGIIEDSRAGSGRKYTGWRINTAELAFEDETPGPQHDADF